jgi:hypothetical protein
MLAAEAAVGHATAAKCCMHLHSTVARTVRADSAAMNSCAAVVLCCTVSLRIHICTTAVTTFRCVVCVVLSVWYCCEHMHSLRFSKRHYYFEHVVTYSTYYCVCCTAVSISTEYAVFVLEYTLLL